MEKFWGNWVKEFRKEQNWTQQKLADKLGISKFAVCKIEQNTRTLSLKHYLKICELSGEGPIGKDINDWKYRCEMLQQKLDEANETIKRLSSKGNISAEYIESISREINLKKEMKILKLELREKNQLLQKHKIPYD